LQAVPCSSPNNYEWLKILASAIAGLFAGLIAEPFKSTLQRKIDIIRLERAIAFDCLRVVACLEIAKQELASESQMWQGIDLPGYQHYWAGKRELF
jgi:hypothetical protein